MGYLVRDPDSSSRASRPPRARVRLRLGAVCLAAVASVGSVAMVAAGCSLIDTSDLTGGLSTSDGATTHDPPRDPVGTDGSFAPPLPDASILPVTHPDAGVDAGEIVDASDVDAYATPCSLPHSFCVDFDDGGLDAGFPEIDLSSGGTLDLDDTTSVSAPRSVVMTLPPVVGSTSFPATLATYLPGPAARAHAQVDLRLDAFDVSEGSAVNLFSVQLDPSPPGYDIFAWFIQLQEGKPVVQEYRGDTDGGVEKSTFPFPASFASFTRVEMTIDLTQSPLLLELSLDGTVVVHVNTPSFALGPATGFDFLVGGIYSQGTTTTWKAHFDNALVDLSN